MNTNENNSEVTKSEKAIKLMKQFAGLSALGKVIIVALLIACILFAVFTFSYRSRLISSQTTDLGLKDIGELATQAAYYTNVQKIDDKKELFGLELSITQKKSIFTYDGVIKAGLDFAAIDYAIDDEAKTITVSLPEIRILSNEVDTESLQVYDQKNNIFNPFNISDFNDAQTELKKVAEEKAIANGLFDSAKENAEVLITGFFSGSFPEYEIIFK